MTEPRNPLLYQIDTRLWLRELSMLRGRPTLLEDVPDDALDRLVEKGFDWVWLLGVWQLGPGGPSLTDVPPVARPNGDGLETSAASPFAIHAYTVSEDLGGDRSLDRLRRRLHERGIRLLLDFVPNHTATDHNWTLSHPEFYIQASAEEAARASSSYMHVMTTQGPRYLAHGRDPNFPPWSDTLQLNYRHPRLREAMATQLTQVSRLCDGVRCDMAMLLLPQVIGQTWGGRNYPNDGATPDDSSFWPFAIRRVREEHPDFLFMAEVYWDLEWELQQQGFDYTYDKRLYDRLRSFDVEGIRRHLSADLAFQQRLVRFLENHEEARAATVFPHERHPAAAVIALTAPGMRFLHEGQLVGRRLRTPTRQSWRPPEPVDASLETFYGRLLTVLQRPALRVGHWVERPVRPAWEGNESHGQYLVSLWQADRGERMLVVVNYGPARAQGYADLSGLGLRGRWYLSDQLGSHAFERDDLDSRGLYLDLPAWGCHIFQLTTL